MTLYLMAKWKLSRYSHECFHSIKFFLEFALDCEAFQRGELAAKMVSALIRDTPHAASQEHGRLTQSVPR